MTTTVPLSAPPLPIARTLVTGSGATVSYRQLGDPSSGLPGLIWVHGGLEDWHSHLELAQALSSLYLVYLPDRRGRGLSSAYSSGSSVAGQVADLAALAHATGARLAGGTSAGAIILLETLLAYPALFDRVAVFEPPLGADLKKIEAVLPRCDDQLARGDVAGALITAFSLMELGPPLVLWAPYWVGRPFVSCIMAMEEKWRRKEREQEMEAAASASGQDRKTEQVEDKEPLPSMRNLTPTLPYEFRLVLEVGSRSIQAFAAIKDSASMLLILSGTSTRPYLIKSCEDLAKVLPGIPHVRLPGLDHLGTGNGWTGGQPDMVAQVLTEFFTDTGRFGSE